MLTKILRVAFISSVPMFFIAACLPDEVLETPSPVFNTLQVTPLTPTLMEQEMNTILALGDSYTIGTAVTQAESFPFQLAAALRANGLQIADPKVVARNGWTTDELAAGMDAEKFSLEQSTPFDLVTLLIGVNNQFRGYPLEDYRQEYAAILARAVEFAGGDPGHVIVLSIPDWGVTPFAEGRDRDQIAAEIDTFNAMNRQEAEEAGVYYVDITPISRSASDTPGLLASDGLHPSAKMISQWVALVLKVAEPILQ